LGLSGFVIYIFTKSTKKGDPVILKIVDKLRQEAPAKLSQYEKLTGPALERILKEDKELKNKISGQDFKLLEKTIHHQFIISIFVYSISGTLFLIGILTFLWQTNKPKPIELSDIHIQSVSPDAKGIVVDTDNLEVSWNTNGQPEDITVLLENVEDRRKTEEFSVNSTTRMIIISKEEYKNILSNRERNQYNRIRAVLHTSKGKFQSTEYKLYVGITILVAVYEQKALVAAMIDNRRIDFYDFEAKIVIPKKGEAIEFLTLGDDMKYGKTDFPIDNPNDYEWNDVRLAYFGPDDSRLIRLDVLSNY
jgi:hypothetical protein